METLFRSIVDFGYLPELISICHKTMNWILMTQLSTTSSMYALTLNLEFQTRFVLSKGILCQPSFSLR